jgi:hypothetical protein
MAALLIAARSGGVDGRSESSASASGARLPPSGLPDAVMSAGS